MSFARIEFKLECDTSDNTDNYIQKITGTIYSENETDGKESNCGDIQLIYMDISSAIEDGVDLDYLFDTSDLTDEYCTQLYDAGNQFWNETVTHDDDDIYDLNMLIIHRIRILPEFRGRGIGKLVIRRSIQQFCRDCGLVVLRAKPYQLELGNKEDENLKSNTERQRTYALNKFEADEKKAYQKLEAFYAEIGFRKLKGTKFMVLNPNQDIPSMAKLRGHSD